MNIVNSILCWLQNGLRNCDCSDKNRDIGIQLTRVDYQDNPRLSHNRHSKISEHGLCFVVYHANGGLVVETSYYDSTKDETGTKLYVIGDDTSLEESLAKIITIENLRR